MFTVETRIVPAGAESEDYAETLERGTTLVIALADGAGGLRGGGHAARRAVQLALGAAGLQDPRDEMAWCSVLADIDSQLEDDPVAGETTLVVVVLWSDGVAGASVGDSVAWLLNESLQDLTRRQQRKPLLGSGAALPVPFRAPFAGGTLLVASDGLWKYADPAAISRCAAGDLPAAANGLVDLVRLTSGALWDDVGVVLCRTVSQVTPPSE